MFWNLCGCVSDHAHLITGLRRQLAGAPLVNSLVQIGTAQQSYLALAGCGRCTHDQCTVGCYVDLMRRVLAGSGPQLRLRPIMQGFTPRPYTRVVVARPGRAAQPLDGDILQAAGWPDARLTLIWSGAKTTHGVAARALAVMRVGVAGPEPDAVLRERGWATLGWATALLAQYWKVSPQLAPPALTLGFAYGGDPYLLLPAAPLPSQEAVERPAARPRRASHLRASDPPVPPPMPAAGYTAALTEVQAEEAAPETAHALPAAEAQAEEAIASEAAAHTLPATAPTEVQAEEATAPEAAHALPATAPTEVQAEEAIVPEATAQTLPAAPSEEVIVWPKGPGTKKGTITPEILAACFTGFLAPNSEYWMVPPGVTAKRLFRTMPNTVTDHRRTMILWLDQAGLLAPATDPARPWREPRLLATEDLRVIAARLTATPLPTSEHLEQAQKEGLPN